MSDVEVRVKEGRVTLRLGNYSFPIEVAPTLVDAVGREAAARATADTLRMALEVVGL